MESDPSHTSKAVITCMPFDSRALCVVCGASAIGRNFDAYTCLSCKAFFRRNAYNEHLPYTCRVAGSCEIIVATRRHCSACRLNKCFQKGMKKDLIRSLVAINQLSAQMLTNRHHHGQKSPTLTTIDTITPDDRLLLSLDDWNLLSNIRNAYQAYCVESFHASHQTTPLVLTTQPYRSRMKLQRLADLRCKYISIIASFMKRILQFDTLVENHYEYIKDSLRTLLTINTTELMKSNVLEHIPWEHDRLLFESVFSENLIRCLGRNLNSYQTLLPYDPLILKLFLINLSLTSRISPLFKRNSYNSMDFDPYPKTLLLSQNYYITLLWKYVIYRLGYNDAILYSARFIQHFLRRQIIEADLMDIVQNRDDHGQLFELFRIATNL